MCGGLEGRFHQRHSIVIPEHNVLERVSLGKEKKRAEQRNFYSTSTILGFSDGWLDEKMKIGIDMQKRIPL